MHRQPGDIWRVDYQLRPDEDAERELAGERIHERMDRHLSWLGLDDPWTLEWSSLYRAHAISLDDYVHGRVVFAGDAAHLVPIFGVRGLNSGFEDADTLAWQLGAVVHGTALPALLAAYSTERREAWAQNISSAEKSTRIMSPQHVGEVATRDALLELAVHEPAFRALMDPRQSTATNAHRSPISWAGLPGSAGARPGDPLVDQAVDVADAEGTRESALFAEFGDGFAVVGVDVAPSELAPIVDRIAAELGPEPVRAVHLTTAENGPGVRLRDRDIVLGRPGDVLVVRPDGLVLCRVPQTGRERLGALGVELGRGMAPGPVRIEPAVAGPDLPMEHVWSSLSASLGQARDPQAFLTRLALSLGLQVGEEAWVRALHLAEVAETMTRPALSLRAPIRGALSWIHRRTWSAAVVDLLDITRYNLHAWPGLFPNRRYLSISATASCSTERPSCSPPSWPNNPVESWSRAGIRGSRPAGDARWQESDTGVTVTPPV